MSQFKVDPGDGKGDVKITQNAGDLRQGVVQDDLSRISAYLGADEGVHTGADSPTIGRHNQPFENKARQEKNR